MTGNPFERMAKVATLVIPILAVLLALPGTTYAQRFTGDLSGTVVDESGGVIPGADVTVINQASKAVRRSVTNADGFFGFAALPAATYTVQIAIQGFNTYEVTGIELRGGDSRTLRRVTMKVSTLSETVSVSAEVALTPLNSGEKSATLTAEQIENVPIVGTSAAEVLKLLPGMAPTTGANNRPNFTGEVYGINGNGEFQGGGGNNQSAIGNYSSNGTATGALDITIDGAPGADPGCNCATSVNPNTEFVQEFKVLQSNFQAEHAKGPVNMTVISKAGGRDFHGAVFGYIRDYHLNSNEWYGNKIGAERTKNKFTYPGFNLSGPLIIPGTGFNKSRDKVFFFIGYEYFKQALDTGFVKSWVPTAAMRAGDFSQAASLGLSGNQVNTVPRGFPGGVIPASQIDPGGQTLLNVFPNPNANPAVTGGFNYVDNLVVDQNGWQGLARVDVNISDSTKMFMRYNIQREVQPFVIGLWWRNGQQQVPYPSRIEGQNRSDSGTVSLTHVFNPTLTNETIFAVTYINFPNVIVDRSKVSRTALGYPYGGAFGQSNDQIPSVFANWGGGPIYFNPGGFDPVLFAEKYQFSAQDNITKVLSTHTLKAGLYYEHVTNNQPGNGNSNGRIIEDVGGASSSGNALADLLLGRITGNYNEQTQNALHNIAYNIYEGYLQDSWKARAHLTVDVGLRISYMGPWYGRENFNGNNPGLVAWDPALYSPTAPISSYPGLTWNAVNSAIPRSAVSLPVFFTPRVGFAWDAKGTGDTVVRGGFGMYKYHDPQSIFPNSLDFANGVKTLDSSAQSTLLHYEGIGGGAINLTGSALDKNDNQQPTTYSWSASVDQKLPWSMMTEISYVGNHQSNLINSDVANINAVPEYAGLGASNLDAFRPYQQYGDLQIYRHDMFANYHGLQALVSRQRGKFNFTAAYTFSKVLGIRTGDPNGARTGSEYIWDVRSHNYGIMGQDRTHVASASASWLLPEIKDNGALNAILGNWQLAGVVTYVSGAPIYGSNGNLGIGGTTVGGITINAPNITGSNQVNPQPVITCDPTKSVPSGYLFNPACFAAPTPGHNGSYVFPYIKTQPYTNLDLSLFKNFPIGGKGQRIQLRLSGYNVLNHPIEFPDPNNNLTLHFTNGVQDNNGFGKLPTDNKFGRRIVQIALRYTF
jgi:carboxypeptidase family protein